MIIQKESFLDNLEKLKELFELQWLETCDNHEKTFLDPDYEIYRILEEDNKVAFFSIRNDDIIGYFLGIITKSIHSSKIIFLVQDGIFIRKEFRSLNLFNRLLNEVERFAKDNGLTVRLASKGRKDLTNLFKRRGYMPEEIYYSKGE